MALPTATSFIILSRLIFLYFFTTSTLASTYNVVHFGAKPDAKTDSSKAFEAAWTNACRSSAAASIYVPKGRMYIKSATFDGPCNNNHITMHVDGTLVAPSDYHVIGNSRNWITFRHVDGVSILGAILDGQGTALWACKHSANNCPIGATVPPSFYYLFCKSYHFYTAVICALIIKDLLKRNLFFVLGWCSRWNFTIQKI